VVAIRKDTTASRRNLLESGDLFDIVLVQMKGGFARMPSDADVRRLVSVAQRYRAKNIVLFAWKRAQRCQFYRLTSKRTWTESSALEIFG
jgi:hypothetical protein